MRRLKAALNAAVGFGASIAIKFLALIYRRLSRPAALRLARAGGTLIFHFIELTRFRRDLFSENIARLYQEPPISADEEKKLLKNYLRHAMEGCLDMLVTFTHRAALEKIEFAFEGLEHLDRALARGRGVVMVISHFGVNASAIAALSERGYKCAFLYRQLDSESLEKLFRSSRSENLEFIHKDNAAKNLMRALRENRIAVILADQNASTNNIFVPFFGHLAATTRAPASLALRCQAALISLSAPLESDKSFIARIDPEIDYAKIPDPALAIRYAMTICARMAERDIRAHPCQWHWAHRRWKTRPTETDIARIETETAQLDELLGADWSAISST